MARRGRMPKGMSSLKVDDTIELLDLWNRALAAPHGIRIVSKKGWWLTQRLYAVRRECGHLRYGGLRVSRDETHVWIVPRDE